MRSTIQGILGHYPFSLTFDTTPFCKWTQLRRDADLVAGAEHGAFHHGVHVQLTSDLRQRLSRSSVSHYGRAIAAVINARRALDRTHESRRKKRLALHEPPAATLPLQLSVSLKSPLIVITIGCADAPVFVIVTAFAPLVVVINCFAKVMLAGET
jgi:hypothetical protein